jgi:hypothetical protein
MTELNVLGSNELSISDREKNIHGMETRTLLDLMFTLCCADGEDLTKSDLLNKEIISKELKFRVIHYEEMHVN